MQDPHAPAPLVAEPTPVGLLGLAVGCAALTPVAFGRALTPDALATAAWFCLLFGAGGQLIAGLMALANKNLLGGTLFTTFAFNWVMNWRVLDEMSRGKLPNASVTFAVDVCFLAIFVVLTYAFGFYGKLLFAFLLDIDLIYAFRIARELTHAGAFAFLTALATVALAALSLWIAFAILVNPAAGRTVFAMPGPLFAAKRPRSAEAA